MTYLPDPTQRFSSRVENYVKYRPDYPDDVLDVLRAECGLRPSSVIADIGSGTGKLAELFLRQGNTVYGVEPNAEMREAGERLLAGYPDFHSLDGTAEVIPLPDNSVDFIAAGQAYHWFDPDRTRPEFRRVLKPKGWMALVWNERQSAGTPFLLEYERLLQTFATDYQQVGHKRINDDDIQKALGLRLLSVATFPNNQRFDYEGLQGRLLSSSYSPEPGHPQHAPMLAELKRIFEQHQEGGMVSFVYATKVYYGQLS